MPIIPALKRRRVPGEVTLAERRLWRLGVRFADRFRGCGALLRVVTSYSRLTELQACKLRRAPRGAASPRSLVSGKGTFARPSAYGGCAFKPGVGLEIFCSTFQEAATRGSSAARDHGSRESAPSGQPAKQS